MMPSSLGHPPIRAARGVALVLLALCLGSAVPALAQSGPTPYQRALALVEQGGEWERYDFARIALDAMIEEHEAVLDRARQAALDQAERPQSRAGGKLRRWRAATMPYLNTLYGALDAVELAEEVEVAIGAEGTVQLLVGAHNVVVSPIDIRRPGTLENAIVAEFCQLHDCGFAPEHELAGGRWVFASGEAQAGYATASGVRCLYASAGRRGVKERACRELGAALATLSTRLKRSAGAGIAVNPRAFSVQRDGPATLSLRMNDAGDWLMVDDPAIAAVPDVMELALPWLAARLQAGPGTAPPELVIPHAELLLEPLL